MKILSIDIETFSDIDLGKCGVYRYTDSPNFDILLFAYSIDEGPVQLIDLASGEEISEEIVEAILSEEIIKTAFNANFERVALMRYLSRKLDKEVYLNPSSWRCSEVQAAMLGLPLHLEGVAKVLRLGVQKMSEGKPLIRYFCIPCKPTAANGGRTRNLPSDAPDKWELFKQYNIRDVEVELEIRKKIKDYPIPESEQALYELDQRIMDTAVAAEVAILRDLPVACVISDISVIGIQVGEQLGVRNIGIANFTWCEQYEFLGLSDTIIARFREVYAKLDILIEYDLMLPAPKLPVPRKQIGFICRRFDNDRIAAIRAQYGLSIFITCGKSADLNNIQIDNWNGTIFATSGIDITATADATVVQLPVETFDTHNYLAASDIVIAKAGWGTISEALLSKRNLVLIEREGVLEDTENIEELKRIGVAASIKESDLERIDMQTISGLIAENIVRENLDAYQNAVGDILREL